MKLITVIWILIFFLVASLILDYIRIFFEEYSQKKTVSFSMRTLKQFIAAFSVFIISFFILAIYRNKIVSYIIVGILYSLIGYINIIVGDIGIITVVWHGILGGFTGLSLFFIHIFNEFGTYIDKTNLSDPKGLISIKEDIWNVFKLIAQVYLSLGIITGVCMSILFNKGYEQLNVKLNAIQMSTAFGICSIAICFWAVRPCYRLLIEIREKGC